MVAEKQGVKCGPHGIEPTFYPVFSKPVYNLEGMGTNSGLIYDKEDYQNKYAPGLMWCEVFQGQHLSTDIAVIKGKALWFAHTIGHESGLGTFDYWEILEEPNAAVEGFLSEFIARYFQNYTGMMNFETIGGKIIEMHLRFADQWPDLYGERFVPELIRLYAEGKWTLAPVERRGYSVVLFLPPQQYKKPAPSAYSGLIDGHNVTSVQISFDEAKPFGQAPMPPGGFRVAIVNGFNLEDCRNVRELLRPMIKPL